MEILECVCGFKTPYLQLFAIHTSLKCGYTRIEKTCRLERMKALPIDKFIIDNLNDISLCNIIKTKNKNKNPFFIKKKISYVKGWNNLFIKKKDDDYVCYKWSSINTIEFLKKYIEYYNEHSKNKILIDDYDEIINNMMKLQ
mgnify:CR=1 FL=1